MQHRGRLKTAGRVIGALLVAIAGLSGCGGGSGGTAQVPTSENGSIPPAVAQAHQAGTGVDPRIVAADNTFGLNLLSILNQGATTNVAISPTSIALVLQIIYNGANGSTQQAMQETLQLQSLTAQDVNTLNAALQASLLNVDSQVQLTLANSLWMHLSSNPVLPSFTAANETYYGATIGDLAGAPANVNAWVSNETNGLITEILPPANYQQVVAVVANTIYFKGSWTNPFDPGQTAPAPFTLADGSQTSAKMMHRTGSYPYFKGSNFQAIRIHYGEQRMSMLVILPDPSVTLSAFLASITADNLDTWTSQLQSAIGALTLPRFTSTFGAALPAALSALGMGIAFDVNQADFSGIAPLTYLSDVEHKTVVKVDESGTVAAGATTGTIGITAVPAPQFTMTVDHPFFYAIQDDDTGALLFVGTLVDPT